MYVPTRSKPTSSVDAPEVGSAVYVEDATVIGDGEFGSSLVFAAVMSVFVPAVETWFRTKRFPPAEVAAVFPIRKPRTLARTVAARSPIWVFGAAAPAVESIAANAAPATSPPSLLSLVGDPIQVLEDPLGGLPGVVALSEALRAGGGLDLMVAEVDQAPVPEPVLPAEDLDMLHGHLRGSVARHPGHGVTGSRGCVA